MIEGNKFEEMIIKELVKQIIDEAKSKIDYQVSREKDKEVEEKNDFKKRINCLDKFGYDLVYKSAWDADKDWLKGRLKTACQDLYSNRVTEKFPYHELFIIGLYGIVAQSRDDLNVDEFQEVINNNCSLIYDLY
ncbi:hypothetical protein [Anaerococcus sp.]|uniref:hypothetical protein n=1 Tax=Anaerococcus sp. TaxID=1872515 RepID=UPI0029037926|nr:hypothetical protein [Anaerococcus sp.]MDU3212144.1 hypothetical protein [Anaerococcus sp.]